MLLFSLILAIITLVKRIYPSKIFFTQPLINYLYSPDTVSKAPLSAPYHFLCHFYSSSRNTRDFNREIRAQSEPRLHREYNPASPLRVYNMISYRPVFLKSGKGRSDKKPLCRTNRQQHTCTGKLPARDPAAGAHAFVKNRRTRDDLMCGGFYDLLSEIIQAPEELPSQHRPFSVRSLQSEYNRRCGSHTSERSPRTSSWAYRSALYSSCGLCLLPGPL